MTTAPSVIYHTTYVSPHEAFLADCWDTSTREAWEHNAYRPHLLDNDCWCLAGNGCCMVRDFLTEEISDTALAAAEADLLR